MKRENKIKYFMNLCFFLYFAILISERTISVVKSITGSVNFSDGFNIFVYLTILLSFLGFLVYTLLKNRSAFLALFIPKDEAIEKIDFTGLVKAGGILLLSGMVHSEYTISPLQFASYGFYIVAIVLQAALLHKNAESKSLLWLSVAYLVAFSMSIPVTYRTNLEYATLYHVIEGVVTYALVAAFTIITLKLFNGSFDLFGLPLFLTALVSDVLVIALRAKEEINYFVLVSVSISLVLFIVGSLRHSKKYYKNKNDNV